MLGWPHLRVDRAHHAVGTDHHGDPLGVAGAGVRGRAACETELLVGVAEQRIGEAELLPERAVLCDGVERDAADYGVLGVKLGLQVTEALALDRSTGGVGLGVEPQHQRLAGEVAERAGVALVVEHADLAEQLEVIPYKYALINTGYGPKKKVAKKKEETKRWAMMMQTLKHSLLGRAEVLPM